VADLFGRVRDALGVDLDERDVAGGVVSGEIPLSNAAVNRLVAKQLQKAGGPVTAARLEALGDDRLTVELQVRAPIRIPPIRIVASIEQQPAFPSPAVLGIRWTMPGLGALAMFAGPALAFLKKLPPGIHVDGDWLAVDVAGMLRERGFGDVLRYVSSARLRTRAGAFVLQFELRVSP
jgi:hypothetical protein